MARSFRVGTRSERGQILILGVLLIPILLGMTGLAIDVGLGAADKRSARNAADAAALAGAGVLLKGGTVAAAKTEALSYASKNGFAASSVTVNIPPASGPHVGDSHYVELLISRSKKTVFMRVVGISSYSTTARAVGGFKTMPKNYALVVLNPTQCSAYNQTSSQNLTITGGGMMVNSSCDPSGTQGGGGIITADYIDYYSAGSWRQSNNATDPIPPSAVGAQIPDPLAALVRPIPCTSETVYTPAGCTVLQSPDSGGTQNNPGQNHITASSGNLTLRPGVYWGGLTISGTGNGANITFLPGTYIFAGGGANSGGFVYSGSANLSGSGVTFFNTDDQSAASQAKRPCGGYSLTGNGVLNFTGPTSGTWKNMLFWQADACTVTFNYGGGNNTTAGVIYLPTAKLDVSGGGNLGAVQVIVDTLKYSGSAPVTINYTDYVQITPPHIALVE